jgi:ubiquinone/menaquinone biosynthesis C-methylase UbiE
MSNYENYSSTAGSYDGTRSATGYESILGMATAAGLTGGGVLLDAGCGTGNYAAALVPYFSRMEAVDMNARMLDAAREKLAQYVSVDKVSFHQSSIDDLPLPSDSVDVAMLNQVLHHLPVEPHWPAHVRVLAELARAVRSGGLLSINTCSLEQLQDGFWSYALVPEAVVEMQRRHVPLDTLESLLDKAGFEPVSRIVPVSAVLQGAAYQNSRGPLAPAWRKGDSMWALPSADELAAALARVERLDATDELDDFMRHHDARRPSIGQITFVFAEKR